jgi:hypothetical protein
MGFLAGDFDYSEIAIAERRKSKVQRKWGKPKGES